MIGMILPHSNQVNTDKNNSPCKNSSNSFFSLCINSFWSKKSIQGTNLYVLLTEDALKGNIDIGYYNTNLHYIISLWKMFLNF